MLPQETPDDIHLLLPGRQPIGDSCVQDQLCLLVASACARHERTIRYDRGDREDPLGFLWVHQPWCEAARTAAVEERTFLLTQPHARRFLLRGTALLRVCCDLLTFSNRGTRFVLVYSGLSSLARRLNCQLVVKYQFASPGCVGVRGTVLFLAQLWWRAR